MPLLFYGPGNVALPFYNNLYFALSPLDGGSIGPYLYMLAQSGPSHPLTSGPLLLLKPLSPFIEQPLELLAGI